VEKAQQLKETAMAAKVVIVGHMPVGKSSLLSSFITDESIDLPPTIGVNSTPITVQGINP
jgi:GTPase SAR1 family protein